MLISGGRDGKLIMYDLRQKGIAHIIANFSFDQQVFNTKSSSSRRHSSLTQLKLQKPSITGICSLDSGNHLVVSESTFNKLSFFDLRMNLDQLNLKIKGASKKPPPINLDCQIDSSEHLGLSENKNCQKITGTSSMRLHKESNTLAVVRSDNQLAIFYLSKLDSEPPKILENQHFKSSFYVKPEFIDKNLILTGGCPNGKILLWDIKNNKKQSIMLGGSFNK